MNTNTLLNKTVKELRVIAKDLGLVGVSKLKKEPLISAIINAKKEDDKANKELSNKITKALSYNWTKTSGQYSVSEIERALKTLNRTLNMNVTDESRFDSDDKIVICKPDGTVAKAIVGAMFKAIEKVSPENRVKEVVKKEVAVTVLPKGISPSEREKILAQHEQKVKDITDKALSKNTDNKLDAKEFNQIYQTICRTFVEMKNTDLSDMWLVNECKNKAFFEYYPDDINSRYMLLIGLTTSSNQFTSEYVKELIVNNFSTEKEVMEKEFDVRRNGKRPTEFIRLAELLEEDYMISDYLEDKSQFFTIEGVTKVLTKIVDENITNKSNQLFNYGLSLTNGKPVSDKMKVWLKKVMIGYKLTEKEDFPYSEEDVFKNSTTAFAINYKYSKYGFNLITENQVKAYLKIAGRYDILGDDHKLNYFYCKMREKYTYDEFKAIINVYANNKRLVMLAIAYDKEFNGEIGQACKYISQLNPMEISRMTSRLERVEHKHLTSLHNSLDDK